MPFFLLKGLSFLPFGGFLKNPKILLGVIIIALLAFGYFKWKSAIKEAIFNEIFAEQAEQLLDDQRRELERVQKLAEEANKAVREARENRAAITREIEKARAATRNVAPERNGTVAPVLSDALDFIRGDRKPSEPTERTLGDTVGDAVNNARESAEEAGESVLERWRRMREEDPL